MVTTAEQQPQSTGEAIAGPNGAAPEQLPGEGAQEEPGSRWKLYGALAAVGLLLLFVLLTAGLYMLGDSSQSALERLRDIAVIYIVLMSLILVIIMAAGTAALIYLIVQIKGQVIPLLQEMTGTLNRVRGTTEFMTEEAVKPVISAAGRVAQIRAMWKVATGRGWK